MNKKTYIVKQIQEEHLEINAPLWTDIKPVSIDCFPWDQNTGYRPDTLAKLVIVQSGISIRMQTDENPLLATATKLNQDVYKDSCMEFFIKPDPDDDRYLNFEFNSFGTLLIGIGVDKQSRTRINLDPQIFKIQSLVNEGLWSLCWEVPFSFLEATGFKPNKTTFKGNFYKCGDETIHPHYGCWSPIGLEIPNFHCPEYFGEIIII